MRSNRTSDLGYGDRNTKSGLCDINAQNVASSGRAVGPQRAYSSVSRATSTTTTQINSSQDKSTHVTKRAAALTGAWLLGQSLGRVIDSHRLRRTAFTSSSEQPRMFEVVF
jgi:hypothetical protein